MEGIILAFDFKRSLCIIINKALVIKVFSFLQLSRIKETAMGVRFHRSIKIAKGVRLNISKTGLGVSVGPRGAKISVGPSGVYSNVGVPGTGLYARNKISTGNTNKIQQPSNGLIERNLNVQVSVDDDTGEEQVIITENGRPVYDESIIRKIKREQSFKDRLQQLREKVHNGIEEKSQILTNIHTYSEPLPDWEELRGNLENSEPEVYSRNEFQEPEPNKYSIYKKLEDEAYKTVKGIFRLKKKRIEYIEERIEKVFSIELSEWGKRKELFEQEEDNKEKSANAEYLETYKEWRRGLELRLNPTENFISEELNNYFSSIQLPVDFSLSYDVYEEGRTVYLDVDLPEIEDYPQTKSQILKSGKVSVKNKTKKEMKEDYLQSVAGISIYFASIVFTVSPLIQNVYVSGYTQRINKSTGKIEDEYVYSVNYDIARFRNLNFQKIDPQLALESFNPIMKVSKTSDLVTIQPYEFQ